MLFLCGRWCHKNPTVRDCSTVPSTFSTFMPSFWCKCFFSIPATGWEKLPWYSLVFCGVHFILAFKQKFHTRHWEKRDMFRAQRIRAGSTCRYTYSIIQLNLEPQYTLLNSGYTTYLTMLESSRFRKVLLLKRDPCVQNPLWAIPRGFDVKHNALCAS